MAAEAEREARLPPRWFIRSFWTAHRGVYRATGGKVGLRPAHGDTWGMMRLTTIGRRSGQERSVILGYFDDGPNLVTLAMNGWAESDPAWWLNLQAHPEELRAGQRRVKAREAEGEERSRLWDRWRELDHDLDAHASRRTSTPVVVLEPVTGDS